MTENNPWGPFEDIVGAPWEKALAWKESTGRKVVGHLLPDVPEEILHAAGALPMAVEGAGIQVSRAQEHIPGYTCSHAMGALELGLRSELGVLDGMVIPYLCDTTRNLFHIWSKCFPDLANEFLRLPKRLDHPGARDYMRAEFSRLFETMTRITGQEPKTDALESSVKLYNKSRQRLRQAYLKQAEQPEVWTSQRVQMLFASALRAPREDHLAWMDRLPWDEKTAADSQERVAVYVRGKVWDPPGILDLFDQLGLLVVQDEIVTGFRSVALDASTDGDPIAALVDRHLANIPYTGYHLDPHLMVQGFLNRVRDSKAKGVIFLNPKFCEAAAFDTPDFQKAIQDANIPSLILETSARGVSLGQIRLRLEAFREMLSDDLP
ncbi:MAG: 2-hydroxyacyl-CoA dehydratase [Desulfomonile tiedjei]|nr:2-hydroxyacyl-CoA dehydratase [Desulfomonile tiedjei]